MTATARPPFWLIAIAASAGGVSALQTVVATLPATLPAAVVVVLHRLKSPENALSDILARVSAMPVAAPVSGEPVRPGCVYVTRPDLHLTVQPECRFLYADGARIRGVLSSANPLLESAAPVFGNRIIAVVLTGGGFDATDGVQAVKASGGIVIMEDPSTAQHAGMPTAAIKTGVVDRILPLAAIGPALVAMTSGERAGMQAI